MGRADDIRAAYERDLALAEAEDELIAAKGRKNIPADDLREIKDRVRALRQAQREQRDGDASVSPAPIRATAGVKKAGGR